VATDRCSGKSGMFSGRCKLESLHPGEHNDGTKKWPRLPSEQDLYEITLQIIAERKEQRAARAKLVERHERGEI
jgi:hypothetical protein